MQVSVKTVGALGRQLTVAVPAEQFEQAFVNRLQRLSRQTRLPGFRPGKAPLKIVEARYGGQVLEEAAGDIIQTTFREALAKEGLKPADGPKIRHKPLERGKGLEYTAEFEIYPEIRRLDLAGVRIERPVATVADADIDRTIETMRKQRVIWRPVEHEARSGERLLVDFTGRLNGQEFPGGSATNFPIVLGSGVLVEGFETGMLGAKAGERRTIAVKFPADYRHAPLAGQAVDFEVHIKEAAEPVLPEVNAEFAKQLGIQDGSLEGLRAEGRANLEREAAGRSRALVRARALQAVLDANPVEIPEGLLQAELARMREISRAAGPAGAAPRTEDEARLRPFARRRVALGLVFAEILRARDIRPDPARVRARLEQMAAEYESPEEFIRWHYANPEKLSEVESLVLEEKIVEDLLATAEVVDRAVGFQELLGMEPTTT